MDDYYQILGVRPDATPDEVRAQYRFFVHAFHPDKFRDSLQKEQAEARFKKVREAFDVLIDPAKRAAYDRTRAAAGAGRPNAAGAQQAHGARQQARPETAPQPEARPEPGPSCAADSRTRQRRQRQTAGRAGQPDGARKSPDSRPSGPTVRDTRRELSAGRARLTASFLLLFIGFVLIGFLAVIAEAAHLGAYSPLVLVVYIALYCNYMVTLIYVRALCGRSTLGSVLVSLLSLICVFTVVFYVVTDFQAKTAIASMRADATAHSR